MERSAASRVDDLQAVAGDIRAAGGPAAGATTVVNPREITVSNVNPRLRSAFTDSTTRS